MNLLWPRFHDRDFRPAPRTLLRLHLDANLSMLRSWRDTGLFVLISLVPVGLLLLVLLVVPLEIPPAGIAPSSFLLLVLSFLLVFYLVQHVAFMVAMEFTYTPHVRAAIRRQGIPICIGCGHLQHSMSDFCPECGGSPLNGPMGDLRKKTFSKTSGSTDS